MQGTLGGRRRRAVSGGKVHLLLRAPEHVQSLQCLLDRCHTLRALGMAREIVGCGWLYRIHEPGHGGTAPSSSGEGGRSHGMACKALHAAHT